ncbi:MAG: pseudouridine synthase [Pseudomonadota bacterium]
MTVRLQKLLARAGVGSRRQVDRWLAEGLIRVNGAVAKPGDRAGAEDAITVRGRPVAIAASDSTAPARHLMYHKPVGQICTRDDPQGRPTVFAELPAVRGARWVSVGRLDINTSGLLLFTTDGDLANALMHPSGGVKRRYQVRVQGHPAAADLAALRRGVELDDGPARVAAVKAGHRRGSNAWFELTLVEGRNREVRRLWEALGFRVNRLLRISYGGIELPRDLPPGRCRELTAEQSALLRNAVKKDR